MWCSFIKKDRFLKFKILYEFLEKKYNSNQTITTEEILDTTKWKKNTFETYYNKKMKNKVLLKKGKVYEIINIESYDEQSFSNFMSQTHKKYESHLKKK